MTKKRGKKFSIKGEYKQSWKYIKECRNYIYAIISIFFIFVLAGFFIPVPETLKNELIKIIQELLEETKGFNQRQMIEFIFLNNLKSSFFGVVFGMFFGIFPVVSSLLNGYLLGFVAFASVNEGGFLILWKLFPHGIFELPAVFISLGMGLKFGTFIFEKQKKKKFLEFFWKSLKVFVLIIIPLLIIAAIIEGTLILKFG
jgi:stage II sporulation protein M